ncbi:hypothetical protein [Endozoicomonas sp.]|uniref:hypothetical protein n=1 Tax=Endozoicomonas sp. TaxID=1892382 RepID=UPI00383A2F40
MNFMFPYNPYSVTETVSKFAIANDCPAPGDQPASITDCFHTCDATFNNGIIHRVRLSGIEIQGVLKEIEPGKVTNPVPPEHFIQSLEALGARIVDTMRLLSPPEV